MSTKIPKVVRQNAVYMSFWTKKGKIGVGLQGEVKQMYKVVKRGNVL